MRCLEFMSCWEAGPRIDSLDRQPAGGESRQFLSRLRRVPWVSAEIVADQPMEPIQIVARHGSEHVVLDMVIHLPVKKTEHRVEGECAAAQAEIIHVVLEPHVLGFVAEEEQPRAVNLVSEAQDRNDPPTCRQRKGKNRRMPSQHDTCPAYRGTATFRVGLGIEGQFPFSFESSGDDTPRFAK